MIKDSCVYCRDIKKQVTEVLYEAREHPLIKKNFHFVTAGAFPWSEDVSEAYSTLLQSSHYLGWITGGNPNDHDFVDSDVLKYAELIRNDNLISREDYNFLRKLGSKIEVRSSIN